MQSDPAKYAHEEPDYIFYGGTFDPPHLAHVESVQIARRRFPKAQITVVPAFFPPSSSQQVKSTHADFSNRLAMCAVAFDDEPGIQISSIEETLDTPSYTYRTLGAFREMYPLSKMAWMIGGDQLASFTRWSKPELILETASLMVVPRPAQVKEDLVDLAAKVVTALGLKASIAREDGMVFVDGGRPIFVLEEAPRSCSSTELRSALSTEKYRVKISDLPAAVRDYVQDSNLYEMVD